MIANPAFFFIFVWSGVLFLYSLRWSTTLKELSFSMYLYLALTFISVVVGAFLISRFKNRSFFVGMNQNIFLFTPRESHKLYIVFSIFLFISILEVIDFQSLPLFSSSTFNKHAYLDFAANFGLTHILVSKTFMFTAALIFFVLYLKTKKKRYIIYYILIIAWNILIISRSSIISIALQSIFISIILGYKIFTIRNVFIMSVVIYLFGFLGHARVGDAGQNMDTYMKSVNFPSFLPDSVIMMYVYIVSALNNVNYNLSSYYDAAFKPIQMIRYYLPGVLRDELNFKETSINLVNDTFNTDTFMHDFLSSFGYYGSLIILVALFMIYQLLYLKIANTNSLKWSMILAVILHNIVLSVFSNSFVNPTFIFEMITIYIIFTKFIIRDKRKIK